MSHETQRFQTEPRYDSALAGAMRHDVMKVGDDADRFLETIMFVAEDCIALSQEEQALCIESHEESEAVDATPTTEVRNATDGAFSVLLKNKDSHYGRYCSDDQLEDQRAYLKSLGYGPRTIWKAIDCANDADPDRRSSWRFPYFGINGRETPAIIGTGRHWRRLASVTVEKPLYAEMAIERRWGSFEAPKMRAALQLILRAAELTPKHIATVQANLDAWQTD